MDKDDGITWNQMRGFSVDKNNRLLWNGEVIVTESKLSLSKFQLFLAVAATLGTLASGVHPFLVSFGIL